jgi:hypothetical protein
VDYNDGENPSNPNPNTPKTVSLTSVNSTHQENFSLVLILLVVAH